MRPALGILLRDLGLILHAPGLMAAATAVLAIACGESFAVLSFGAVALVSTGAGQVLFRSFRDAGETTLVSAMTAAAIGWILVPMLGAVPFLAIARHVGDGSTQPATLLAFREPLNAAFEAFSGFTGTGLTVTRVPADLPLCLQWWRSFMQWVGGAGVIVLILLVMRPVDGAFRLYFSEGRDDRIRGSVLATVRTIAWIFGLFTVVSVLLLRVAGMSWWAALNHGMTAIATGGFSLHEESLANQALAVQAIVSLLLIAGAISFASHHDLLTGRGARLRRDPQLRAMLLVLVAGAIALVALTRLGGEPPHLDAAVFQWISATTTAGFQTADVREWSAASHLLLTLAMVVGGAAGSTAGGIKLFRAVVLLKGISWHLKSIVRRPHEVVRYAIGGESLEATEASRLVEAAAALAVLWVLALGAGVLVLLHVAPDGASPSMVVFEVASAQSNVGLSSGITGSDLHWLGRLALIVSMYLGRLEIIPALLLFRATMVLRRV